MSQPEMTIPTDLSIALSEDAEAKSIFDNLSLSHQKEYIKWIEEAKKTETRAKRIQKTIEMLKQKS